MSEREHPVMDYLRRLENRVLELREEKRLHWARPGRHWIRPFLVGFFAGLGIGLAALGLR